MFFIQPYVFFPWNKCLGNFVLIHWSIMGMVIMFAFTCNLRALLMRAVYEKPIDTMEDVVKSGQNIQVIRLYVKRRL